MWLSREAFVSFRYATGCRTTLAACATRDSANSCTRKMNRRSFARKGILSAAGVIIVPRMSAGSEHKDEGFFSRTYKRMFAAALESTMPAYETSVADRKQKLFSRIKDSDTVVDIGMGTGPNLKYLPKGVRVFGVDPNEYMRPYASEKAEMHNINLSQLQGVAESLPLQDSSCDVAITTLTLCSVKDPRRAIQEILRVLKPGGEHLFIEHVIASEGRPIFRRTQNVLTPLQAMCADGCHLNRDTAAYLEEASNPGFSKISFEEFDALTDSFIDWINPSRPHICGFAQKEGL